MPYQPIEDMRMYRRAEGLADAVWNVAEAWPSLAQRTVGMQMIRSSDSIGANIAEAYGRHHVGEAKHHLYYARGSLRETKFWLRRALARGLITTATADDLDAQLERLSSEINAAITAQRARVADPAIYYDASPGANPAFPDPDDPL